MNKKKLMWMTAVMIACAFVSCAANTNPERSDENETIRLPKLIFSTAGIEKNVEENPKWLEKKPQNNIASTSVDVHLFIDGSESMRGYLSYSGSTYERMVTSLPAICINAFEADDFNTYKLFEKIYTMKDKAPEFKSIGDNYVDYACKRDFYGTEMAVRSGDVRAADKKRSDFGQIIERIREINPRIDMDGAGNDLYIIVSDFIPQNREDTDFYHFNSKLYTEILSHDLCCGVAGFMSGFNGRVACLDEKGRNAEFTYDGDMPFYIMVIGETRNVTKWMSAMTDWVEHFELESDEYGIFITDGQSPRNIGSGDTVDCIWEETEFPNLVKENMPEAMVSYELLHSNACKRGEILSYTMAYNVYPFEKFSDRDTVSGEIHFELPYSLSPASSINIKDGDWTLDYDIQVVYGEVAIDPDLLEGLDADCEGQVDFPEDISVDAFEYIYLPRITGLAKAPDLIHAKEKAWAQRTQEYLEGLAPRTLCGEEMFVSAGAGHVKDGDVIIPLTLKTAMMEDEMPYLISVNITAVPKITTQPLDDWIGGWSLENDDIATWIKNPESFSTGKTPGLFTALKALQGNRIYDNGYFTRQVNLIVTKGEMLADEDVKLWANEQIAKAAEEAKRSAAAEKNDSEGIFDIFKKGDE